MKPMKALWDVLYNWRELWLWPLVALLNVYLLIFAAFLITKRWPQESADALVGLGFNILLVTLAISLTSILRESTGKWWKQEDEKANPHILWSQMIGKTVSFVAILWALKH